MEAIKIENLWKQYRMGLKKSTSFRETLSNFFSKKDEKNYFWALKEINFEIQQGEAVGLIGKNGAGKSTLLKILSRITYPTNGQIEINGRVSSLLEVGTGFHPELTGRQNVFLNGTILGMTRREIQSKFDEIVDFSGVEKFIDTPVKHYSSGMKVRLAFSVAAHLEPEILIIDEVLAVGDAEFQNKCLGKMEDVTGEGRTVLFVSHNMAAVSNLCSRVIVMDKGQIKLNSANVSEGIQYYLDQGQKEIDRGVLISESNDFFSIDSMLLQSNHGSNLFTCNDPIEILIKGEVYKPDPLLNIGIVLYDVSQAPMFHSFSGDSSINFGPGRFELKTSIPADLLNNGEYEVEIIADVRNIKSIIRPGNGPRAKFQIEGGLPWTTKRPGSLALELGWLIN